MFATKQLLSDPNIWTILTTRQVHLLRIGRCKSLQRDARPHTLPATDVESVLDLHIRRILDVRERHIHCANLLLAVEESNMEALGPGLCRDRYAEILVD
jgi:hypothetical protein